MNIDEELKNLVNKYNEAIENKNKFHDLAQKCLGAIEALQSLQSKDETDDKKNNRKDTKKS
tara:strand:+ start:4451 stop:4633 length:183 start_codon:yes stop_codon:yes gene_type:complete